MPKKLTTYFLHSNFSLAILQDIQTSGQ